MAYSSKFFVRKASISLGCPLKCSSVTSPNVLYFHEHGAAPVRSQVLDDMAAEFGDP